MHRRTQNNSAGTLIHGGAREWNTTGGGGWSVRGQPQASNRSDVYVRRAFHSAVTLSPFLSLSLVTGGLQARATVEDGWVSCAHTTLERAGNVVHP
jgi:hypothetical protein